jgi:phage tail sheath protein FI
MPEYLSPGVYIEEVSLRSKSIEGVPTSITGFAGMTRFGPVHYPGGPLTSGPRLIRSFSEFEAVYGGLEVLHSPTIADCRLSYTAHAARSFFMNGGTQLYISRVFSPRGADPNLDWGVASHAIPVSGSTATWNARWPGAYGNVWIETQVVRGKNAAYAAAQFGGALQVDGASSGSIVEVITAGAVPPTGNDALTLANLAQVTVDPNDGRQIFNRGGAAFLPNATDVIQNVTMRVVVTTDHNKVRVYDELSAEPSTERYIGSILGGNNPEDEDAVLFLAWDPTTATGNDVAANLMVALQANSTRRLTGGHDGVIATPADLAGQAANPDDGPKRATGLAALGEIDDIAIVALPDGGAYDDVDAAAAAGNALIEHAEELRYRFAVIDPPLLGSMTQVRDFRRRFESSYAAIYYPWLEILDPSQCSVHGAPPTELQLPPSGFITGICGRSDLARGVFKAPANEPIFGLVKLASKVDAADQDALNAEGINALRHFEGRGDRVWGARTISSDPVWRYISVRRLFIFLEHSIDKGTRWAVFEPNNEKLWADVRHTIDDFLFTVWKDGALMGSKPEDAYFVRCDRTTMTQNDLDNGRLICLIGVAPTKPAEFVIFRIGQWTAGASTN